MLNLTNHLLIAMPTLYDSIFTRSVVYICEHDENGAMGLMLTQPLDVTFERLLRSTKVKEEGFRLATGCNNQVLLGGPLKEDRGFILHGDMVNTQFSYAITAEINLSTSMDLLAMFGTEAAPQQYLIALGYVGWSAKQLEQELLDNSWLTLEADADFIFTTPTHQLWQQAVTRLGFDVWQLSNQIGHA